MVRIVHKPGDKIKSTLGELFCHLFWKPGWALRTAQSSLGPILHYNTTEVRVSSNLTYFPGNFSLVRKKRGGNP